MTRAWLALGACAALLQLGCAAESSIGDEVRLDSGRVSGVTAEDGILVFRGLPFAAPPVGELRWRPPQPVEPWDGVRSADTFGNVCIQPPGQGRLNIAVLPDSPPLDEDCLYLNVWTGAQSAAERRPVMVYIYGGAFTEGAGSVPLYDGTALARKGAVVVTMNYRLGPYGFFAHPDLTAESEHGASGNYGLMDMLAALEWVQSNIAAFGGDPGNVTVFGQSAGAMAIAALVASPRAEGLFRRAISQSGAWMGLGMGRMQTLARAEAQGAEAAAAAGVSSAAELRALTPAEVTEHLRGYGMLVDGWVIPEDPSTTFAEGRQLPVDVLAGSNKDEGSFFPGGPTAEQWVAQARTQRGELADRFLELYPAGSDEEAAASSLAAFRDGTSWHMRLYAERQVERGNRAYVFYFAQDPPYAAGERSLGATHAAEVPYVFDNLGELPLFPDRSAPELAAASAPDRALADAMSSYWVNFARSGDPNGAGLPEWPAYTDRATGRAMVLVGEESHPEMAPDTERLELFDALYARLMAEP